MRKEEHRPLPQIRSRAPGATSFGPLAHPSPLTKYATLPLQAAAREVGCGNNQDLIGIPI